MCDTSAEKEKKLDCLIQHYESITSKWVEYYKLYMQSWTIFGSAVLAGALFAFSKGSGDGTTGSLQGMLLVLLPLIIMIWFLLTSHFWAMFDMYAKYASDMEASISKEFGHPVAFSIYSHDKRYWYLKDRKGVNCITLLAAAFGAIGYLFVAWEASKAFSQPLPIFFLYVAGMVVVFWTIVAFGPLKAGREGSRDDG